MPAASPSRVTVSADATAQALRGRLALSAEAETNEPAEPGSFADLYGPGGEYLGAAVLDRDNELWRVFSDLPSSEEAASFLGERTRRALALRERLGIPDRTEVWRAVNSEGDGLPGIAADVFGSYFVVYAYGRDLLPVARTVAQALVEARDARGAVVKLRLGGAARPGPVPQEIVGETPPESLVVREHGLPLEIHPLAGLNTGLFTDLRPHRQDLARWCNQRRVLNLFAYSGGLSVVAARSGAKSVTSVDRSAGALEWARANFRHSGLDAESPRFRFEAADVPRFVRQAAVRCEEYDVVLIDPPAVSAEAPSSWSQKRDYPAIIAHAAELLSPDGVLWLADHATGGRALGRTLQAGVLRSGREARVLSIGGLPPDYPTSAAHPESRHLQVAVVEVGGASRYDAAERSLSD